MPLCKRYDVAMLAVCHVRGLTSLCKGLQYSKAEGSNLKRRSGYVELWSDGARTLRTCDR